jgi:hypothetical protein
MSCDFFPLSVMATINWHDTPEKGKPHRVSTSGDPWFGISMGLFGFLTGIAVSLFF